MSYHSLLTGVALIALAGAASAQTLSTRTDVPAGASAPTYRSNFDPNIATRNENTRQTTISTPYATTTATTVPALAPASGYAAQPQTLDGQLQARQPSATAPVPIYANTPPVDPSTPVAGGDESLYVSGGVGEADRQHLKDIAGNYNLKVQMATASGEFVSDVDFKVSEVKGGATVFQTSTNGPLLMAKLKPGTYKVEATKYGVTKTQNVTVGKSGTKSINVFWNNA